MIRAPRHLPARRRAFTLTELLVVMGAIAVLSLLTLVSVRGIARDARVASAINTVTASLDNARALAMKSNAISLLVFRPRVEGSDVVVDLVMCEWTGESYGNGPSGKVIDRFAPVPDAPVRSLPAGIKVAAPLYGDPGCSGVVPNPVWVPGCNDDTDDVWVTQSHLPATANANEVPGGLIGVMYDADGTTITANPQTDAEFVWADFDLFDPNAAQPGPRVRSDGVDERPQDVEPFFAQFGADDEPFIRFAPFLAVYDDDVARQEHAGDWTITQAYFDELIGPSGFINRSSRRIHFNRYTGVAMK